MEIFRLYGRLPILKVYFFPLSRTFHLFSLFFCSFLYVSHSCAVIWTVCSYFLKSHVKHFLSYREKQRETELERESDRQKRERDREKQRETYRYIQRDKKRQREIERYRERLREIGRDRKGQVEIERDREI